MHSNAPVNLDKADKKILLELEVNARQSAAKISKKARLSEEVVNYRIKKFLKQGIIEKFLAIPIYDKLGISTYRIYLQFLETTPQKEDEIIRYLVEKTPCQWLGVCDGRWDVIGRIAARDIFEFNRIMNLFFEKYGKFIRQKTVNVQLRHTWWPSTYGLTDRPPPKHPLHEVPKDSKLVKHDELDLKILGELVDDARCPTVQIAQKVGSSPDTVHYRIKRLIQEGVLIQMIAYLNREKLGYQHNQIFVGLYPEQTGIKKLISFLNSFPECFFISSMVGGWDMQFGLDAKNSVEFHELFGRIKKEFPQVIREYETLIVYKEYSPNPFRHFI